MKPLLRTTRPINALNTMIQAVKDFLPTADTLYADPFCGFAEVPFELELPNCVLSDTNPHFINFYNHVKNGTFLKGRDRLSIRTGVTRQEWSRNKSRFIQLLDEGKGDTADAAQLTFYLSHTCGAFTFISRDPLDSASENRMFGGAQDLGLQVRVPDVDWQAAQTLMQNWKILHLTDYNQFFDDDDIQDETPLVINAPVLYRQQWDGITVWQEPEHEVLRDRLSQHPGNVLVFHPRRSSIQRIYSAWSSNPTPAAANNHRAFQVLPRR